jgi:energy-coupling factor transporter ATP-binding protein EcfA2
MSFTNTKAPSSSGGIDIETAKMWAKNGDAYFGCEEAVDELPAGQYTVQFSEMRGIYFSKTDVKLDELLDLPDNSSEKVIKEIEIFWEKKEIYTRMKVLWKRGILLFGPPGSGKTTCVQQVAKGIINNGGCAIYVDHPGIAASALAMARRIEPDRPLVIILEDLDSIIYKHSEADLLALLDGELQIDNVVFIATTNYPEKLDRRIVNRPSRFDVIQRVGMPSAPARRQYLITKLPELLEQKPSKQYVLAKPDALVEADSALNRLKEQKKKQGPSPVSSDEVITMDPKVEAFQKEFGLAESKFILEQDTYNAEIQKSSALDEWVDRTDGFSVAHLKELIISTQVYGRSFEESLKRLRKMGNVQVTSKSSGDDLNI